MENLEERNRNGEASKKARDLIRYDGFVLATGHILMPLLRRGRKKKK